MKNSTINKEVTIAKQRGERVKELRKALRYSRRYIAEKHQFNHRTLQNWEDGRYGGLTESAARLLAKVFTQEGYNCRPEWLMYGTGLNPLTLLGSLDSEQQPVKKSYQQIISEEFNLFCQHQQNVIDMIVKDDAMLPCYLPGDFVAGERCLEVDCFTQFNNQVCIIQTLEGELLLRLLQLSKKDSELFNLIALNDQLPKKQKIIHNTKLFSVAPILWLRRNKT